MKIVPITPAPWFPAVVFSPDKPRTFEITGNDPDFTICRIHCPPDTQQLYGEYLANATLILAAPELLMILKVMEKLATTQGWNTPLYEQEFRDALQLARHYISKAETTV